jgi:hypothetical protein
MKARISGCTTMWLKMATKFGIDLIECLFFTAKNVLTSVPASLGALSSLVRLDVRQNSKSLLARLSRPTVELASRFP